ncbi:hypothetical protein TDMWS_10350 [Thermodesulfomicrobium sp. WS]|uniref:5-formyltetrahydrofolate cyclo-ligase n=1 Tax=Thermodesulfomicrobium sp. WS TaxID=3004129 RepID=UPI002493C1A2|nr:5-formyltetrahydrofolate cyclo-ligase [Thermodesulfomicrobium sp. WS]BDV00950.1 hypothetical protein TDMWS_10350 [Thermodesulfomicrobium sp. WS]
MSGPENASLRTQIRHAMHARRLALSEAERHQAGRDLCTRLLAQPLPGAVAVYIPFRGELDTWPIIHALWQRGVQVLAPRCRAQCPGAMDWFHVTAAEDLVPGSFGILEPDPGRAAPASDVPDWVLVPGLAFDIRGFRLGYGGGFYDRYLAAHPQVCSMGLAYDFQLVDLLPTEPWDQPVRCILTPTRTVEIFPCPQSSSTSTSQDCPTSASPSPPAVEE